MEQLLSSDVFSSTIQHMVVAMEDHMTQVVVVGYLMIMGNVYWSPAPLILMLLLDPL